MIKNQLYNVVNYILENPKSSADYRVINLINSKVSDILGKGGVVSRTPDGHK